MYLYEVFTHVLNSVLQCGSARYPMQSNIDFTLEILRFIVASFRFAIGLKLPASIKGNLINEGQREIQVGALRFE